MDVEVARHLAEELLAPLGDRWAHTQGVAERAVAAGRAVRVEGREVLVVAAWLHDVGYAPALVDSGLHPLDGARFLARGDVDEHVVALVAHHSGADVEAQERDLAAELASIPRPDPVLLDALTFADMTTGPQGDAVDVEQRLAEILSRYSPTDPVHRAVTRSAPLLRAAVQRTRARVVGQFDGAILD